ncbi:DUF4174 domain-containing protein [Roseivivax sediminis]|uniref:DUF4174 domain-containing protein n=1 Tax=Roseivivax sediminis TaxID=936889 RepID=A0A1I2A7I2_9RHOB|nr:DUF4174 domain-containing protein [Roseivivax sediminis]SFE38903.1 protein of unknown function [Roseivivax sediminis]
MRRWLALVPALGLTLAAPADAQRSGTVTPLPPDTAELSDYRWSNRPVLLFADADTDAAYAAQRAALAAAAPGLADRDIVVLTDTDPQARGALRARFAPEGFLMVLVGKDGGVKRTETAPISADDLFATIDAMPMRRREMSR